MELNGVEIVDTYCEAFGGFFSRILITAKNEKWANIAAQIATGYGTSTIHCDAEAAIDLVVPADQTPDKRPGVIVMFFISDKKKIGNTVMNRIGQCVLTCPTTACFDALDGSLAPEKEFEIKLGANLRYFGDKFEEKIEGKFPFEAWKIPVMDGEFIVQNMVKAGKGIAGGNFLIIGKDQDSALEAAEKSIEAIKDIKNVIAPFPGGVARSGSKVGSKYSFLGASTNDPLCPTLRGKIDNSQLKEGENCVYEIILDGATEEAIKKAMKIGIEAAVKIPGILRISAGNYGGKLGKFQYNLQELGLE
ncbi:MAG: formylmethanofuran--tetrahydromethanopterin N-formyltransferase [Candidatus Lokiarchaeota archaeon]|nr:formylmethanofuran--tetrahydromethanopterin N-formyltransferase [Candidatus Lokiarchaeota archaeon]MBD3340584.1 formylmethanofuran--tetrahydromethanopterin N-formyltransferase [Candidatus Lokiarchaeota archaeon]